jgi:hypothetical protein|tara:strand:+ start:137 stop:382 length:246 start_codon:yes stop_codon:yes gene_type:complete
MIKSTLNITEENFSDDEAKRLIVMTSTEQAFILSMVESLESQAGSLKEYLRMSGFDHYSFGTDSPRTVARLQLTRKKETSE